MRYISLRFLQCGITGGCTQWRPTYLSHGELCRVYMCTSFIIVIWSVCLFVISESAYLDVIAVCLQHG